MSNTVRIKRRASGSPGAPASLQNAELAFNEVDSTLYYGVGTGGTGGSATTVLAIGGPGGFVDKSTAQTIGGVKTFSSSPVIPTPTTSDNSTNAASTAFVKAQGYLTTNQNIAVTGDATGSGTTAISLTLASVGTAGTYTKVTTDAKGRVTSGTTLVAGDLPVHTTSIISDFTTAVRTNRLDQLAAPGADVSWANYKITNLADPISAQDAATKNYVDTVAQGLDPKASVKAATTANITLSGTQTIDGVALVAGDRVLVKNQTTTSQNGIYVVAASTWARATDMDVWTEVPNAFVFIEQGTTNADTGWVCTADQGGTIGTTAVTWSQFSGAGTYLAGNGLSLTGNTFAAVGTANRIVVSGSGIDIASNYVGQNTITTLGTVTTGTWNGTTIAVSNGGTGATTLTGLVKGNGTSAMTAAVAGTDYQAAITASGLLKGAGAGSVSAAVAGTDYQAAISASGLLKGAGGGSVSAAVDGTDYLSPNATIDGGTF